jgi:hypothetical protein
MWTRASQLAALAGAAIVAAACGGAPATSQSAAAPRPAWVDQYFGSMIGTWVADNASYRSEAERADAYAIDWAWGVGRQSIVGRLYSIEGGAETGTHWEFREYWHPGEGQLIAAQWGADGRFGAGPHVRRADGTFDMVQAFFDPVGAMTRTAHESEIRADHFLTRSFDVAADGRRTPRRTYTWKRRR